MKKETPLETQGAQNLKTSDEKICTPKNVRGSKTQRPSINKEASLKT
jgi:hypothetical protein